jgi:hypothetical protein
MRSLRSLITKQPWYSFTVDATLHSHMFFFLFNFHSCTLDLDTIKVFYLQTDAQ